MSTVPHDPSTGGASGGEAEEQEAVDDQPQFLRMPGPWEWAAFDLYDQSRQIRCEVCLRIKQRYQTGELERHSSFGTAVHRSISWHKRHPNEPRGDTIWKCIECSMAIDTEITNGQSRFARRGTSTSIQPSYFHRAHEADMAMD